MLSKNALKCIIMKKLERGDEDLSQPDESSKRGI